MLSTPRQLDAGEYHTCARLDLGRLRCWGLDSNGQPGDGGTNTDQAAPVPSGLIDEAVAS